MQVVKTTISPDNRKQLITQLNQTLSDAVDLALQCKQAHWNVKGENFIALHELFDRIATEATGAVDLIAERVMQLGGQAMGTVRVAAKQSRLKEYPLGAVESQAHVKALAAALKAFTDGTRRFIDESAALGDAVTADMLTEITRGLDTQLWFVESHLA